MDSNRIIEGLQTLSLAELHIVRAELNALIQQIEGWQKPNEPKTTPTDNRTYRQEHVKCGKPTCKKCKDGKGHGPYWYAYWTEQGKTKKEYIGKTKPATM